MSKAQRRKPLKSGPFHQDAEPKKKKLCQKWFRNECPREESKCRYYHGSFPCKFYHLTSYCKFEDHCRYTHGGALSLHMKNVLVDHVFTDGDEFVRPFKRRSREELRDMLYKSEAIHDAGNNNEEEVPAFNYATFSNEREDLDGKVFYVTNQFASYNVLPGTNSVWMDIPPITPVGPPIQQRNDQPMDTYNDFGERSSSGTSRQHRISTEKKGRHLVNEEKPEKTELCRKWGSPRGNNTCKRNESECWYYHGSFPCKFYHIGKFCKFKDECRFTHGGPLSQHLKEVLANHIAKDPDYVTGGFRKYTVEQSLALMERNEKKLWEKLKCKVGREENFGTNAERRTPANKRKDKPQRAGNVSKKCKTSHVDSNSTTNSVGTNELNAGLIDAPPNETYRDMDLDLRPHLPHSKASDGQKSSSSPSRKIIHHCDESPEKQKQTLSTENPKTTQTINNKLENYSFEIRTTSQTPTHTITTEESNYTKDSNESSNHTKDSNESSNNTKDSNESSNHTKDSNESSNNTKDSNESSNHTKDSNESSNHTKDSNESSNHTKDFNESPTSTLSINVLNEIGKWMLSDSRFDGLGCSKISKVIDDNRNIIAVVPQSGEATIRETSGGRDTSYTEISHDTPESPPKRPSEGCWNFTRRPGISHSHHSIQQPTGEKEKLIPVSSFDQSEGNASELSHSSSSDRSFYDTIQTNPPTAPEDDFYSLFTRRTKAKSPDEPVLTKLRKMELEIMRSPTCTSGSKSGNAGQKLDGFNGAPPNGTYQDVDLRPYLPYPKPTDGQKSSSSPSRKTDLAPAVTGEKSKLPVTWKLIKIRGYFGPAYEDVCLKVTFDEALKDPRFKKHLHRFF